MKKAKIVTPETPKKLKAVIGSNGDGVFLQTQSGRVLYLSLTSGTLSEEETGARTLEAVLEMVASRQPVYEGDVAQIEF